MAQDRAFATRKDRRHPLALPAHHSVPNRIHTAMKQVEAASAQAPIYRTQPQLETNQLSPCNHSVLASRQLGNQGIRATSLQQASHIDAFCILVGHGAMVAAPASRVARSV